MDKKNVNKNIDCGRFIAFEGIDGSGKSTQAAILAKRLKQEGIRCYMTMEPTNAPIGSLIRQVLTGRVRMDNRAIAGLFAADRLDHLLNDVDGILAKVQQGTTVITDRYYFSSYAYHSVDAPMEWVIKTNEQSSMLLRPTITIFIDISPDEALERIAKNRFHQELFEEKSRLVQVRNNYKKAFELLKNEEKVIIIDGNQTQDEVAASIWSELEGYFYLSE